jgi:hypothetical protein
VNGKNFKTRTKRSAIISLKQQTDQHRQYRTRRGVWLNLKAFGDKERSLGVWGWNLIRGESDGSVMWWSAAVQRAEVMGWRMGDGINISLSLNSFPPKAKIGGDEPEKGVALNDAR